jgi:hypothetical protein
MADKIKKKCLDDRKFIECNYDHYNCKTDVSLMYLKKVEIMHCKIGIICDKKFYDCKMNMFDIYVDCLKSKKN